MKQPLTLFAILVATILCTQRFATAQAPAPAGERNWPQWRGPLCTGASATANPPVTWDAATNIRWKVKLPGSGTASPVVWDDRIFIQTAIPTGRKGETPANDNPVPAAMAGMMSAASGEIQQFVVMCIDRQSGKTLWQKTACEAVPHEGHHRDGSYASSSPVTDGKRVFASFGSRGIYCYDMEGNLKWQKDLGRMKIKMTFGEGSSPALFGETLVINWDHEGGSFIAAFDAETGKELWRQPRDETTSWATPLIVQHGGGAQVVMAATKKVRSYDLASGKLIWECAGLTPNVIPTPVAADGVVYAISGYKGNAALAIRLGRGGDLAGTDAIAWSYGKNTPYVPSPVLFDQRLCFFAGNAPTLTCLDIKTGKPLIDARKLEDLDGVYASPVAAAGRIYLTGRNGTTVVIKASDKLEVLATNKLEDRFDASPALAGTDLLLRGRETLYCITGK